MIFNRSCKRFLIYIYLLYWKRRSFQEENTKALILVLSLFITIFSLFIVLDSVKLLPENRKYKTFSAVPEECKGYILIKPYIDIEKELFSLFSTQNAIQEKISTNICSIIEENEGNKYLFQYLINILVYYILIRPKQAEIPCFLLSHILSKYENKRNFIRDAISTNEYYNNIYFIQDILYSQKIIEKEPKEYAIRKNDCFSLDKKVNITNILIENDIKTLKKYFQQQDLNQNDAQINIDSDSPLSFSIQSHTTIFSGSINLLDFCSFYSSLDCFKFLQNNGYEFGNYISLMSVAGGDFSIIHQ